MDPTPNRFDLMTGKLVVVLASLGALSCASAFLSPLMGVRRTTTSMAADGVGRRENIENVGKFLFASSMLSGLAFPVRPSKTLAAVGEGMNTS
jgi:hypothetical protein